MWSYKMSDHRPNDFLVHTKVLQPPQFSIIVNDTEPIFFYCSAPGACIQDGMVGVINPVSKSPLPLSIVT